MLDVQAALQDLFTLAQRHSAQDDTIVISGQNAVQWSVTSPTGRSQRLPMGSTSRSGQPDAGV
jgi:hypothetical protein